MVKYNKGDIVEIVMIGVVSPHYEEDGSHRKYLHRPITVRGAIQARDCGNKKYSMSFHFLDGNFVSNYDWICISPVMLKRCKK